MTTLTPDREHQRAPAVPALSEAVTEAAEEQGALLVVSSYGVDPARERNVITALLERGSPPTPQIGGYYGQVKRLDESLGRLRDMTPVLILEYRALRIAQKRTLRHGYSKINTAMKG